MKRNSKSLAIREMQIKTIVKYVFTHVRMAQIFFWQCQELVRVETLGHSHSSCGDVESSTCFGKWLNSFFKKKKTTTITKPKHMIQQLCIPEK